MGVLKAKVDAAWVEVGGSPDVLWVGPDAPTDPAIELWADTDAVAAPSGGGGYPLVPLKPFSTTTWTWVNQGAASVGETANAVYLHCPGDAAENMRVRVKALPAGTPTITVGLIPFLHAYNWQQCGVTLRESGTGKLVTWSLTSNAGTGPSARLVESRKNSSPTVNAGGGISFAMGFWSSITYFRVQITATQYVVSWSFDGLNFPALISENKNAFFTTGPDQIGISAMNFYTPLACGASFVHWSET